MSSRRRVVLLGSTGSIGTQAAEVIRAHADRFEVVGLAAGRDVDRLLAQADEFGTRDLALADRDAAALLRSLRPHARVRDGVEGITELAALPDADVVLNGIVGSRGLLPTLAALEAGHTVALANKESLIVGGELVLAAADGAGRARDRSHDGMGRIVPVDSEHSALAQCLRGGRRADVARLVLTASGGPFRGRSRRDLAGVTATDALAHPTWHMGPVITVNSATLMNKGLELIEAHLLFGVAWEALDVVVHPQSVVHSMVEFVDGATLAQLSPPDMRLPIQMALAWPERLPGAHVAMDWTVPLELTFEPVDRSTFRSLDLCEAAGRRGGTAPAVLNAANEQAVAAFLSDRIGFLDIAEVVEAVLDEHLAAAPGTPPTLDDVLHAEGWARVRADELLRGRRSAAERV
ncbi:MAG TPA: 1-deoxy-D-xylulose-5-phosphate reductoisomerase [Nitriliruptorales bacterium]|nr:1-deoxy-D-xylulose-5-phosphate reductoisomerase [Nitriliruptorales bacterium]